MVETDTMIVATRFIIERLVDFGREHDLPDYAYRNAVARGGSATGPDQAGGRERRTHSGPHRRAVRDDGHELRHLVAAGMTPLQAIKESTASAPPLTLGPQPPASSELKQGYDADLIAVSEDPLDNLDVIAEPKKVTMVFNAGRRVKRED